MGNFADASAHKKPNCVLLGEKFVEAQSLCAGDGAATPAGAVGNGQRWKFLDEGKLRKVSGKLFPEPKPPARRVLHICHAHRVPRN